MNFYAIAALINMITSLLLGLFVFFKNKKSPINNTFVLLSLAVFVWSIFYLLWQISTDRASALLYTRLLSIGSTFIPIFYLHWVLSFLEIKDKKSKAVLFFGYLVTFLFLTMSFSPLFIRGVEKILVFDFWPKAGPLYTLYLLISYAGLVGYGLYVLAKNYLTNTGLKRYQIRYIIFGTIIGFFGGATNFFLWYNIKILPVGNVVVSLYVFILFYAMIKYRLMDIRIIARKVFIYFGIAALTYGMFYGLIWLYYTAFGGLFTTPAYLLGVIIAPLFVALFYTADNWLKDFANKYLFVSLYNYQETINKLIDGLVSYIDLDKIINLIVGTIKKTMQLDRVDVFLADANGDYQIFKIDIQDISASIKNRFLVKFFLKNQKPLVREELPILSENSTNEKEKKDFAKLSDYMAKIKAAVCLPLIANKKLIGIIVLGSKISRDPYTNEDLNLLNVLSKQAGVAIENALQYKQIQEFGETLQEKVYEQTKDIRKKNTYLLKAAQEEGARKEEAERISKSKTEFISIVSHQLRTPLTAIRGYTSMLKDGDFGGLSEEADNAINYIHESSVGMIKLVNSLLAVSRLEKGQIELKIQDISIEDLLKECVRDIKLVADDKGLYIKYNKPDKPIPLISGDPDKLKQAIGNIINNAIHYTVEGGVEITLSEKDANTFCIQIKDTGIGIDKEDAQKIFKSFSRGKSGTEMYTQGTGLGLYVAKNFIEMHNGKLLVESEGRNKGSVFTIELPIKSNIETKHDFVLTGD